MPLELIGSGARLEVTSFHMRMEILQDRPSV